MSLRRPRRLQVEGLESRITPAVTVKYIGSNLFIQSDNLPNNLKVEELVAGKLTVTNNGKTVGAFKVNNLSITTGNSNDTVTLKLTTSLPGNLMVSLGNGSDYFTTKTSTVGAKIGGTTYVNTGLSTKSPIAGKFDETIELYNLRFSGNTTVIGAPGSAVSLLDTEAGVFPGTVTAVNMSTMTLGKSDNVDRFTTMGHLTINNFQKNTDSRADFPILQGRYNLLNMYGGSKITGNLSITGGSGRDYVFLPANFLMANNGTAEIGGNVTFSAGEGINSLALGNLAPRSASVGGSVTFVGGSDLDRFLFDSGSTVAGNVNLSLGNGDNQLFGDSVGIGETGSIFNAEGTGSIAGNLNITLGNGNNFIGSFFGPAGPGGTNLSVAGNLSFIVGNGNNVGGDAFAPGAISFFNDFISVGGVASYRAGTGTNNLNLTNNTISSLRLTFSGGPTTIDIGVLFNGSFYLDFGTGFGPKTLTGIGGFDGPVTILNYP